MNKNKVILLIILGIIAGLFTLMILNLDGEKKSTRKKIVADFTVWIMGDKEETFTLFLDSFKKASGNKNTIFNVESFSNYEEYYYSLASAISSGQAPDVFVLNNNEKSIYEEQTIGINPSIINSGDFRKKYKRIFSKNLILVSKDGDKELEFLKGIPIGYETLGIFYNRKYIKSRDLSSLLSLGNIVSKLKKKDSSITPIGIGNGTNVYNSSDIVSQFFLLEDGVDGIDSLDENAIKSGLSSYMNYGDKFGDNKYNSLFSNSKFKGKDNLDLFSAGKVSMVVGYPRIINKIDKNGYSKAFLEATVFPHYSKSEGKSLINYNYFVVNKDSKKIDLGLELLKYMTSDEGAKEYLELFPYYLPASTILEGNFLEEKIHENYNILLKDFYNFDFELSSFNKGVKTIYDKEIIKILDNTISNITEYKKLNNSLKCKRDKFLTLDKLSINCE